MKKQSIQPKAPRPTKDIQKDIQHAKLEEALMGFRHTMTCALMEEAKGKGCSLSHFEVIKYIAEKGSPSMKDIAVQLHITPPSTSTLIDTLVKKGLVTRSHAPEDRRTIHVMLTPAANVFLTSIYSKKTSLFNKMLSKLSTADKTELARILTKCS
jgi:DNA-binding MarR family transcriptional regulator